MVVRIVIAGESQCESFAEVCLVADYISKNLPNFCYERIEKPVVEWETWLFKVNQKNKWHHRESPIIWKEMLMKGSKPFYIGGASQFLEYCHSYYKVDSFISPEKIEGLFDNFVQYQQKEANENQELKLSKEKAEMVGDITHTNFVVCITGAGHPLVMHLISELLDISVGQKSISKIYLHDSGCSAEFLEYVERECSCVDTDYAGKVVKYIDKIGSALTHSDLLIVFDHAPFDVNQPMGSWLRANRQIMEDLALYINASATRKMYILFPNIGPACYNATTLSDLINLNKNNVVVATSDLGIGITSIAAEIAEIPLRNMFCPPVWGFVGINHLVDIRTTVHRYDSFQPYNRYLKVRNSSLSIGCLTPELRTMEYLMYFDETLWKKVAESKNQFMKKQQGFNKVVAVLDIVKLWLFERNPNHIVSLGIQSNGAFGLTFRGKFSQPARFVDGEWVPAEDFLLPKDPQIKLKYLQEMAVFTMKLQIGDLPNIIRQYHCTCKTKYYKKKGVW